MQTINSSVIPFTRISFDGDAWELRRVILMAGTIGSKLIETILNSAWSLLKGVKEVEKKEKKRQRPTQLQNKQSWSYFIGVDTTLGRKIKEDLAQSFHYCAIILGVLVVLHTITISSLRCFCIIVIWTLLCRSFGDICTQSLHYLKISYLRNLSIHTTNDKRWVVYSWWQQNVHHLVPSAVLSRRWAQLIWVSFPRKLLWSRPILIQN